MLFICKCDSHDGKTANQRLASFQFSEESCICRSIQLIDVFSYELLRDFVHNNWIMLLNVVINMSRVDAYWTYRYCIFKMYFDE